MGNLAPDRSKKEKPANIGAFRLTRHEAEFRPPTLLFYPFCGIRAKKRPTSASHAEAKNTAAACPCFNGRENSVRVKRAPLRLGRRPCPHAPARVPFWRGRATRACQVEMMSAEL